MALTSFNVDPKMDSTLETLKAHYGASSKAEIIRKAITLLSVVKDNEQTDGSVLIRTPQNKEMKLLVR